MGKLYVAFLGVLFFAITWSAGRQTSEADRVLRAAWQDEQRAEVALKAEHARGAMLARRRGDVETADWYARLYGRPSVEGLDAGGR
jgi:hypothetical protein